ncbi:uncharacterized protein BDV14DRAFT_146511 [Aspergillus stella-maris]|uniref:uncharacterized protein n=1 Tax=Aspergillus stella-maris TaxID=1810926 RepID=UPI003CCD01DF
MYLCNRSSWLFICIQSDRETRMLIARSQKYQRPSAGRDDFIMTALGSSIPKLRPSPATSVISAVIITVHYGARPPDVPMSALCILL